ncbi:PHB domain-containing protein [Meloidogyne graminicola]|uniref:PHB domain-containing protein n=1 Tax=Meloidogyne graminicola TaxID=189291 RepID=A0A8S9ZWD2_9BILA|nr:PHB domain-containing protein [Meloidogyne graminicola]
MANEMQATVLDIENNNSEINKNSYTSQTARKPCITEATTEAEPYGLCAKILIIIAYILTIITFPISVFSCIKIVNQYERAVIFRLGQLRKGGARGPGLFFIIPCIDEYRKVDLRVVSFQVPPQELLSKDSVTANVDAVVYFRVSNATISIVNVEDATASTKLLAMTTLRNVLGTKTLSEMLSDRDHISHQMQEVLDEATEHWGVKVERVEVKDVRLPREMQRAMAAEAEATREAKAKIIAAEGEQKASRALRDAALQISDTPTALQLRYLQTLGTISAEHNSTIVFPFPVDFMSMFVQNFKLQDNNNIQQHHSSQTAQHVNNFCGDLTKEKGSDHQAFVPD